ncbi:MAG: LysR substrate-binding domain-containing protein [Rhizobacter sp.]
MPRQFTGLMLGSVELFCLTAELQGFTAAAAAAGLTPAAVSRSIARLEARLGVQLFVRTTRQVRLTDSGRSYYEQCRQALGQLVEAERELTGDQRVATGTVRISLPTSYGHYRVLPLLPAFRQRYPGVELEVQLSNRNVDFAAEGYDLAVRGRVLADSGLIARPLDSAELVIVATPQYLRRRGTPRTPDDLKQHECVQFYLPSTGLLVPWRLRDDKGREFEMMPPAAVRCSGDVLAQATLARHGGGIAQTFRTVVEQELKQGTLKELLKDFGGTSRPFALLYPANRHMPQRVRVLIDFLVERLAVAGHHHS